MASDGRFSRIPKVMLEGIFSVLQFRMRHQK